MDAVRVRDGLPVMLKRLFPEEGPYELEINQSFSSPGLADPRNHCAPLLDVIELQGPEPHKIMVFPLLRPFNRPRFQTIGEFVAFFTQICEVVQILPILLRAIIQGWSHRASNSCINIMWPIGTNRPL